MFRPAGAPPYLLSNGWGGDFLLGVKQPWPETEFSLPSSTAEVKNVWNYDNSLQLYGAVFS